MRHGCKFSPAVRRDHAPFLSFFLLSSRILDVAKASGGEGHRMIKATNARLELRLRSEACNKAEGLKSTTKGNFAVWGLEGV